MAGSAAASVIKLTEDALDDELNDESESTRSVDIVGDECGLMGLMGDGAPEGASSSSCDTLEAISKASLAGVRRSKTSFIEI